uniref:Uncharacterized protein n=1 Tax=Rhizophora mucronata TaxID=61149 RepID=A0A2P2R4P4_RHIMU
MLEYKCIKIIQMMILFALHEISESKLYNIVSLQHGNTAKLVSYEVLHQRCMF